ncbi:MAG: PrsW family glutamic-type intramembrane protease [Gemmataceae bacterium]
MNVRLRCLCGKENVHAAIGESTANCMRCGRPLSVPAAPVVVDPNRLLETEPAKAAPDLHPAASLEVPDDCDAGVCEYLYWLLPLALVPLAFVLGRPGDDTLRRFRKTLDEAPVPIRRQIERVEQNPNSTLDDLLSVLPGKRIQGALLPRDTSQHWLFAGLAVVAFFGVTLVSFPQGRPEPGVLLAVAAFTATVGVALLLLAQSIVGSAYDHALDGNGDFVVSLCGYILGVGLFEEAAKALPLLWRYRHFGPMRWRTACLWGLASGVGFGVTEGSFYAEHMYNGLSGPDAYFVRFASCVGLHAIWSASVALSLCRYPNAILSAEDKAVYALAVLRIVALPAVFHGLYDVLLQYHHHAAALAVAVASFGVLAWQIETTRHACRVDGDEAIEPQSSPAPG